MNPRESMKVLPSWTQPFLTWLTGRIYAGQRPKWSNNAFTQTFCALSSLAFGIIGSVYLFQIGTGWSYLLMLITWTFTFGAARNIQVTLIHQCSHGRFSGLPWLDKLFAHAMGIFLITDDYDNYFHEHVILHHSNHLATPVDPDLGFLITLGFKPGMSKKKLWLRLAWTLVSPFFHFRFIRGRLKGNLQAKGLTRRISFLTFHTLVLGVVIATNSLVTYMVAYLFPIFFLYHIAALLNFSSLHLWLKNNTAANPKERMCQLSHGRFCGSSVPPLELRGLARFLAWAGWSTKMLCYHLPVRLGILVGDLPVHDYHHRYPKCKQWGDYLYTRQYDLEAGSKKWPYPYLENWGLIAAIDKVFHHLSQSTYQLESYQTTELTLEGAVLSN